MLINFGFLLFGVLLGGLVSWMITHIYYNKSIENQEIVNSKIIAQYKDLISENKKNSDKALKLEYINLAAEGYKRAGTPVKVIDSFDIPNNEKAEIYDSVMMRVKGRLGKSNKYRK